MVPHVHSAGRMKNFLFGFVAAFVLFAVLGGAYLALGLAPVATAAPPLPFEKTITGIALNAAVRKGEPKSAPMTGTEENYAAGARVYRTNCAVCHGLPGQDQTAIAKGEFPKPPELFKGHGVTGRPGWRNVLESRKRDSADRHAWVQRHSDGRSDLAGQPDAGQCG